MNWYHRTERRYVEYGSSLEATRAFGLFRTSLRHRLQPEHVPPLPRGGDRLRALGDAGVRTACTPFLVYRGRTRHELGLEGLLRRVAVAADFHHAVWGPDELFYGELYASRRVPCKPTLARPGTRDEYSACVGRELVDNDLFDFMLFSLPDHDYHSHRLGPDETLDSIAHADASLGRSSRRRRHRRLLRGARGDPDVGPRPDARRAKRSRSSTRSRSAGGCCSRTGSGPRRASSRSGPTRPRGGRLRARRGAAPGARALGASATRLRSPTASISSPGSRRVPATRSNARASAPPGRRPRGRGRARRGRAALHARVRRSRPARRPLGRRGRARRRSTSQSATGAFVCETLSGRARPAVGGAASAPTPATSSVSLADG